MVVAPGPRRFRLREAQVGSPTRLGHVALGLVTTAPGLAMRGFLPKDAAEGPTCVLETAPG